MPNSLNTPTVPAVEAGTTLQPIPMEVPTASDVDSQNAVQLILGLRQKYTVMGDILEVDSYYQKIAVRLSAKKRYVTLKRVRSAYLHLLNEGFDIPQVTSNSFFPTTAKKVNLRASKPVISINIAAKRQSTTTKAVPPMFSQFTTAEPIPF